RQRDIVAIGERKPAQRVAHEKDRHQRQPGIEYRVEERHDRGCDGVERRTAPPGDEDAHQRAERKAQRHAYRQQRQRPREILRDDLRHWSGIVVGGDAEIAMDQVIEVGDVLHPEGISGVDAELDFERLESRRAYWATLRQPVIDNLRRIPRRESRQEEVDRDGGPYRQQVDADTAEDVAHHATPYTVAYMWLRAWLRGEGG